MAAVDADKVGEVLRERYDWINLVGVLKQRYPAFPEEVLARVVVRLKGNQQLIEDVLSVQNCVQIGRVGDSSAVMTPIVTTPNTSVQSQRSHESNTEMTDFEGAAINSTYPSTSYPPIRTAGPMSGQFGRDQEIFNPPIVNQRQDNIASLRTADSRRRQRHSSPDMLSIGGHSYSFIGHNSSIYSPGYRVERHGLGLVSGNNLDIVPENQASLHRQTSDINPPPSGPMSLHSLGSTSASYVGSSISLQLIKYKQMKKKVENIKVDVERIRTHVAQEEEELNAKATVAKNPTSREVNRLQEETQVLQQELLHMLKELDEFGEPFGEEPGAAQVIPHPNTFHDNILPAASPVVTVQGEGIGRPNNRPASRFPYPHVTGTPHTQSPQPRVAYCFSNTSLTRPSLPIYEHANSYPPEDPPSYMSITRQQSSPVSAHNLSQTNLSDVDTSDNDDNEEKWSCGECTYLNHIAIRNCEMCDRPRE